MYMQMQLQLYTCTYSACMYVNVHRVYTCTCTCMQSRSQTLLESYNEGKKRRKETKKGREGFGEWACSYLKLWYAMGVALRGRKVCAISRWCSTINSLNTRLDFPRMASSPYTSQKVLQRHRTHNKDTFKVHFQASLQIHVCIVKFNVHKS